MTDTLYDNTLYYKCNTCGNTIECSHPELHICKIPKEVQFEKLSKEIGKIQLSIIELETQKGFLERDRQKVCPHNRIEEGRGDKWFSYPEWGTNPFTLKCIVCGLLGKYTHMPGQEKWLKNYEILTKLKR